MSKAFDKSSGNRIADIRHDDGRVTRGCGLYCTNSRFAVCDDHAGFRSGEFCCEGWYLFIVTARPSYLDPDVSSFDIAERT